MAFRLLDETEKNCISYMRISNVLTYFIFMFSRFFNKTRKTMCMSVMYTRLF